MLATLFIAPLPLTLDSASALSASQLSRDFKTVSAGGGHSLAIATDGSLFAWGSNYSGQLGDGTTTSQDVPVLISTAGVTFESISAGGYHSLAIATDGTLYAWGGNDEGQLGDGTATDQNAPVPVLPGTTFEVISAGPYHSLAIGTDGTLYSWGANYYGELGDGTTTSRSAPAEISVAGVTFEAISAGDGHSLAIAADGTLYAWGANYSGQLGDGTTADQMAPVEISVAGVTFEAIAAGGAHSIAIATNGSLYAWGDNFRGQIGDGTTTDQMAPVETSVAGKTFGAISAGGAHSLAIATDGTLYAWGYNNQGQLGDGTTVNRSSAVEISVVGKTFEAISAGENYSLVIAADGALYAWGHNNQGQIGFGAVSTDVPLDAGGELNFSTIEAGNNHSLGIEADGSLHAWGFNLSGQLGDGTNTNRSSPSEIAVAGKTVKAVSAGSAHSLAITTDGVLYAWGFNLKGQLGDGTTSNRNAPVEISVAGKTFEVVSAGGAHSLAITTDGLLYAWGEGSFGKLGSGSNTSQSAPIAISVAGKTFEAVSAGNHHSLAITTDGLLYAWGVNSSGQLGDGTTGTRTTPVAISVAGKTFEAVSAGENYSLAIATDGTLFAWGYNNSGQLGDGTTSNRNVPVEISVAGKVFDGISAGVAHSLAVTTDGSLYSWGQNNHGKLGDGTTIAQTAPVEISVVGKTYATVSAGLSHSLAITTDGKLSSWGNNDRGQLANPSLASHNFLQPTLLSVLGAPAADSANSAPAPYAGPLTTSFSASDVAAGDQLTISGERLDSVTGITIDGVDVSIAAQTAGSLSIVIPAGLESGVKNLRIASTAGMLTVQGAFRLLEGAEIQPETSSSSATKGWTKKLTDSQVKIYAKDLVGAGKIQFIFNGEEIAWVNAVSAADSKLKIANGTNYLVRTVNLVPGQKNVFEVHLDGERIRRSAYSY